MITAELLTTDAFAGWRGNVQVYKLSEPVTVEHTLSEYNDETNEYEGEREFDHLVISAAVVMITGPEVYIFPANAESVAEGDALEFLELPGSLRGTLSHQEAISGFLEYINKERS